MPPKSLSLTVDQPLNTGEQPIHNLLTDTRPLTDEHRLNRRRFLQVTTMTTLASSTLGLVGCHDNNDDDAASPSQNGQVAFLHGVASGDPLADRVILWSRLSPTNLGSTYDVQWQIATDANFSTIINQGKTQTDGSRDYTIKVDATGLAPNQRYYYRFICQGLTSPVGRTKTLPVGNVEQAKLAVVCCSNYPAGYFNVYADIAKRADLDAVIHLGDYIYEYGRTDTAADGSTVPAYGSAQAQKLNREVIPAEELLTITAYRLRYAQYRTDKDLQALHAALPMIAVWDDHEVSNDAYKDGAENHQSNEGNWEDRKLAAMKAYHEWMPTRNRVINEIYRSFDFGNLLSLHMLDTRIIARDQQLNYANYFKKDNNGQLTLDVAAFTSAYADNSRQLIGPIQQNWLAQQMQASKATWQILGQQILMAPMFIPAPVLMNFMNPALGINAVAYMQLAQKASQAPASLTAQEQAILSAPSIPYNLDAWDGYAAAREAVFAIAKTLQKNLVVLSGDTHNAWANNLMNQNGEAVGVEFATSSVTSPGFEGYLPNIDPAQLALGLPKLVKSGTLKWCETAHRGYMIVTATPEQCRCDWLFVDTITQTDFHSTLTKSLTVLPGQPYLVNT